MAKHEENKDLRLVSRIAKINYSNKTIQASKTAVIGIRTWGRIDYLVNHCGWFFIYNNEVKINHKIYQDDDNSNKIRKNNIRKQAKEKSLTNKKKR